MLILFNYILIIKLIILLFCHYINTQILFLNTTNNPKIWIDPPDLKEFRIGDIKTIWLIIYTNETYWNDQLIINCDKPIINCPLNKYPLNYLIKLEKIINSQIAGKTEFFYRIRILKNKIYLKLTNILIIYLGISIGFGNLLIGLQLKIKKELIKQSLLILIICIILFIFKPLIGYLITKYLLINHLYVIRLSLFIIYCLPVVFSPLWIYFIGKNSFFVERYI
ncbi:hypothetical protein Mgra_00006905 [Meloidogyne graminicola]|uniref:Uncharacterized protein n=1 Tax=Meloidogyne graminicola TaxID=189291 RepID=A0A8S9ZKL8_9BILA|nr:hypothetical protein Mgra_00006905 [Meloidogyne graminicola]